MKVVKLNKMIKTLIIGVILILGLSIFLNIFKYKECKKFGHSTLYCILNIG